VSELVITQTLGDPLADGTAITGGDFVLTRLLIDVEFIAPELDKLSGRPGHKRLADQSRGQLAVTKHLSIGRF
jgi:hypothetical protein